MATFYITFGQRYRRETHPQLGARPELPDGWLTVEADGYGQARYQVHRLIDGHYSDLLHEAKFDPSFYPAGHLGTLQQALAHHRG